MMASLSFDAGNSVLLVRYEGVVDDEILTDGCKRAAAWVMEHGRCTVLSDFSDVVSSNKVTASAMRRLAMEPSLEPGSYFQIIIAPQDEMFGLGRMYQILGSSTGSRVEVVRSVSEAYAMAGVEDHPDFRPVAA